MNDQMFLVSEIRRFFFSGNLGLKKLTKFWIPNLLVGCSQGLSVVANLASKFLQWPIKFEMTLLNWELKKI